MKCELCHEHEAERVIYRQTQGKRREELYVCRACAEREAAFSQERGIQVATMNLDEGDLPPGVNPGLLAKGMDTLGLPPPRNAKEALSELGKMFGALGSVLEDASEAQRDARCPKCGQTLEEIRASGMMGCPACYIAFRDAVLPLLSELNDCTTFGGTFGVSAQADPAEQRKTLRAALAAAIAREDYAQAKRLKAELDALAQDKDAPEGGETAERGHGH